LSLADASGASSSKILVSEKSARSVHEFLAGKGVKEDDLLAKGLGKYVAQSEFINSSKCQ